MKTNKMYIICLFSEMEAFIKENIDTAYALTMRKSRR